MMTIAVMHVVVDVLSTPLLMVNVFSYHCLEPLPYTSSDEISWI